MLRSLLSLVALTVALCVGGTTVAQPAKKAPPSKAAASAKLRKIVNKLDPEIRAAQVSLRTARTRLRVALNDEVLREKGPVEGKVIDRLKGPSPTWRPPSGKPTSPRFSTRAAIDPCQPRPPVTQLPPGTKGRADPIRSARPSLFAPGMLWK